MPYVVSGSAPAGVTLSAEGDDAVLKGWVTGTGALALTLRVTDARGVSSPDLVVPLSASAWVAAEARLLQSLLRTGAAPLSALELEHLDAEGNANGRYDVGDLRAYLIRQGAPGA